MKKQFLQITILILGISNLMATPVKINGKDINEIINSDESMLYEDKNANNIAFFFENGLLQIGSMDIENLGEINNYGLSLWNEKDQLSRFKSKKSTMDSLGQMVYSNSYVISDEVLWKAGSFKIFNSILESPSMFLISNEFDISSSFMKNPGFIQLESKDRDALIDYIRISFTEDLEDLLFIEGNLNLTNGLMTRNFVIVGANKIEIAFGEKAFN